MKFITDADLGLVQSKLKITRSYQKTDKNPSIHKVKKEIGVPSQQTTLDLYYSGDKINKKKEECLNVYNRIKNEKDVNIKQTRIMTDHKNRIIFNLDDVLPFKSL